MDSVGACIRCGKRLCAEHAQQAKRGGGPVRNLKRPEFRYKKQIELFEAAISSSGTVICPGCRFKNGLEAARSVQISNSQPTLLPGGSQRLRKATVTYLLREPQVSLDLSDLEAQHEVLFEDLIQLVREKETPVSVPVEWEAEQNPRLPGEAYYPNRPAYVPGKVRRTAEIFPVLSIGELEQPYESPEEIVAYTWYITPDGKWFKDLNGRSQRPGASSGPPMPPRFETTRMHKERAYSGNTEQ